MTLIDNIARKEGSKKIQGHKIENALTLYFHDHVDRDTMITKFGIPVSLQADFDKFKSKYDSFPNTSAGFVDQTKWIDDLHACIALIQQNEIDEKQFNFILGLTLDET